MTRVSLKPMTKDEYRDWLGKAVIAYAGDKARSLDIGQNQALALARASFSGLLPDGPDTRHQHLFTIFDEAGTPVGQAWFAMQIEWGTPVAFIYEIEIQEDRRGQGLGSAAMLAMEDEARVLGAKRLALHVFGHNPRARALYERLGYEVTDYSMAKPLAAVKGQN